MKTNFKLNKTFFKTTFHSLTKALKQKSPFVLLGGGILSGLGAVALAIKQTFAAKKKLDEAEQIKRDESGDESAELTKKEKFLVVWKKYVPVAALVIAGIVCVLASTGVLNHRYEALIAAYGLLQTTHNEYVDKIIETVGDKEEKDIRQEIVKDKVVETQKDISDAAIIKTNNGDTLFVDVLCGRAFYSSYDAVNAAVNRLNHTMIENRNHGADDYIPLNEFYDELNLPRTSLGDYVGFYDNQQDLIEIIFEPVMASDGKTPAVGSCFSTDPEWMCSDC